MTDRDVALTCEEVTELAGLYVLDALEPAETEEIAQHLAACAQAHEEFAELGSVVPALATVAGPVGTPAALKRRVMEAYRADMANAATSTSASTAAPIRQRSNTPRPAWYGWAAAAAALLIVAVVGAWGISRAAEADRAGQRVAELERAVAALAAPGASVALLQGSGPAAGANGFAAFPPSDAGYVVMTGLPEAPAGRAYQAWYIIGDQPSSAGLLEVGEDGYALLSGVDAPTGTELVALTLEPAGGSELPTSDPIVVGEVSSPA